MGSTLKKVGRGALAFSTGGLSEVAMNKDVQGAAKDLGEGFKKISGNERFDPSRSQYEPDQRRAIEILQQRVAGESPSVAEEQMKQGMDTALGNQVSALRSAPGLSPGLQARLISRAGQDQATEMARAKSILRAGEQAQAEQSLVGAIQGARGQDLGLEQLNAQQFESAQKRRGKMFGDVASGLGSAIGLGGKGGAGAGG